MKKKTEEQVRIQDDLYQHVNGEWQKEAVILPDLPVAGSFVDLMLGVEKTLMADFDRLAKDEREFEKSPEAENKALRSAVKLYKKAMDVEAREKTGIRPVIPLLNKLRGIQDIDTYNAMSAVLLKESVPLPFEFALNEDVRDTSKQVLCLFDPGTILPDKTLYEKKLPSFLLKSYYKSMIAKLLKLTPLTKNEQREFIKDTFAFDDIIRKKVLSHTEMADYVKLINPLSVDEAAEQMKPFDLRGMLKAIYGEHVPELINIGNPTFVKEFKEVFCEENFKKLMHWTYVETLIAYAPLLSKAISDLASSYANKLTGTKENPPIEKQAFRLVSGIFDQPVGVFYGRKYFGEAAKEDITAIVRRIIEAYKVRVENNTFLDEKTKETAVTKLSAMKIKMGYPDSYDEFFDTLTVNDEDSFFTTMHKIKKQSVKHYYARLLKPTDFSQWSMPGHMVNACYDPFKNDITFPAAILQKPFYSVDQKLEENLGGIGAVIGHEISHAFDNNGSHFDENGSLKDWWQEKDLENFKEKTKAMTEQFDGIPFHGGKVNGELVVSENIADNGGMAVTLQIMHELAEPDFKAYFINWAKIWAQKAKESYIKLLLTNDVHSPAELRANITPRNFSEWYETFDVTEDDGMYISPDKRLSIW